MRKKRTAAFMLWLTFLIMLAVVAFFQSEPYAAACVFVCAVLPLISIPINLLSRSRLSARIKLPSAAAKNDRVLGEITIKNNSLFPINMYAQIQINNRLTGEESFSFVKLSVAPKAKESKSFEIELKHCGYIVAELKKLSLMDGFGFLGVGASPKANAKMSVMPDTFPMSVLVDMYSTKALDADAWSEYKKGEDYSELFALKEYAPGDSVKQIHWKLSSKLNKAVVKEGSFPENKSLLLFWDKNTSQTATMADVMAEIVSTTAKELTEQGWQFCLAWSAGEQVLLEEVESSDDLMRVIPQMLKSGGGSRFEKGTAIFARSNYEKQFGKSVCFIASLDEGFVSPCEGCVTVLCADVEAKAEELQIISFSEESYKRDLQAIEL